MEEHTTPTSESFADLNQNSATLLGGKVDIVDPSEYGVLSNGVHVEDKNENRPRLSELDKKTTDSTADMTSSTSQDTGFGSTSESEVSSPVENSEVIDKLQNQNAESETEGGAHDNVVVDNATDNDENTLNDEASFENVHTSSFENVHTSSFENVRTADCEDVHNAVVADNEGKEKTEKPVGLETENTRLETEISGNEEQDFVEKAKDEAEVEHVEHTSDTVVDNVVQEIAEEDHVTKTEQKPVDVGSTEHKESDNENVDSIASDKEVDRNVDDTTNTHLEVGQNKDVNEFDSFENVEYNEVNYQNTEGLAEVVDENVKNPTNDEDVEKENYNKLKEPEIETPATNDVENENIEKVTNDITQDVEMGKAAGDVAEIENKADEREEQHKVADVLTEVEKAAGDKEEQKVADVLAETTDHKAENEKAANEEERAVMDILGNGLLKKKVLIAGKGVHTRPNNGDIVTLKVDGQLPDGTHIDTEEITFNLNEGDVILAFDLAVALMEEGEKCELFTSERYAYGSMGREPDIPKDTSITYTLELVKIEPPPAITEMIYDQRLQIGEAKRERGNYLFGRTDYSGAINSYSRAVKLLDNPELNEGVDESCRSVLTESWVKCYNNLAACQLKIDAVDAAIKSCEKVLSVQKDNVKALFRLGKAYGAKGEIDEAISFLRRAIKLEPESKLMQQEMLNLTRRKSKETATEKELYQRMLGVRPGEKSLAKENKKGNSNKLVKWTLVAGGVAAVLISVGLTWYRAS